MNEDNLIPDGTTPFTWRGQFFDPYIGHYYYVPSSAANYGSLRGRQGECIDKRIGVSHVWAAIAFEPVYKDDKLIRPAVMRWVRTTYLQSVNDDEILRAVPHIDGEDPITEKFARVWTS